MSRITYWYRFYPSSKTCSACGHRLDEPRLDVREWTSPKCGTGHDRDINAARNILLEGLKQLIPGGTGEVRTSGGEGACPVAVSARIVEPSNACQPHALRAHGGISTVPGGQEQV